MDFTLTFTTIIANLQVCRIFSKFKFKFEFLLGLDKSHSNVAFQLHICQPGFNFTFLDPMSTTDNCFERFGLKIHLLQTDLVAELDASHCLGT